MDGEIVRQRTQYWGAWDPEGGGMEELTMRETNWQRGHGIPGLDLQGQVAASLELQQGLPSSRRPRPGNTRFDVGEVADSPVGIADSDEEAIDSSIRLPRSTLTRK